MSDQDEAIRDFLVSNASHHIISPVGNYHSWPCGIWMGEKAKPALTWTDLFSHGLVPKNWRVITIEPA